MKVKVKFFASFREILGKKEDEIESTRIITLKELLTKLSKRYGKQFTDYSKECMILINGRGLNLFNGLETNLKDGDTVGLADGDTIEFLPLMGGG